MPATESIEVELGEHTFIALAQPHAYLIHEIPEIITVVLEQADLDQENPDAGDIGNLVGLLGEAVYDLLNVLLGGDLKKKLPSWEFHGYPTREAWQAREYDEVTARKSPTMPQIADALEALIALNGDKVFKKMFGLIDPKPIRAAISLKIADSIWQDSPSSPPTSGALDLTSSGAANRTETANGLASPSLV